MRGSWSQSLLFVVGAAAFAAALLFGTFASAVFCAFAVAFFSTFTTAVLGTFTAAFFSAVATAVFCTVTAAVSTAFTGIHIECAGITFLGATGDGLRIAAHTGFAAAFSEKSKKRKRHKRENEEFFHVTPQ